jgi:hypothetical protein
VSLALVMSGLLWLTHWSDSLLGLAAFFVLTAAVLSTSAYVRAGRRGVFGPTPLKHRGDF